MTETRSVVPRIGRVLDVAGLLVFLAGAVVYGRAWLGLREMDAYERGPGDVGFAAVQHADALSSLARIGIALMLAGGVLAVVAAVVARRVMARAAAPAE